MKCVRVLCFSLLIFVAVAAAASAQTAQPTVRLVGRSGTVEIQRGNIWMPLNSGDIINFGERVRTGARSSGAIELGPGKVATLSEKTEVQVRQSDGTPVVQLESGNMKVVSAEEDIQVAAKETVIQSTQSPVEIEVGRDDNGVSLTVITGAVRNGPIVIRSAPDTSKRTYTAGNGRRNDNTGVVYTEPPPVVAYPAPFYPYYYTTPYGLFPGRSPFPPQGTVPPVVYNPTHPGYRPDQIVPPMSNPLAVPIMPAQPYQPPFRR
jgi:hypothetical protein